VCRRGGPASARARGPARAAGVCARARVCPGAVWLLSGPGGCDSGRTDRRDAGASFGRAAAGDHHGRRAQAAADEQRRQHGGARRSARARAHHDRQLAGRELRARPDRRAGAGLRAVHLGLDLDAQGRDAVARELVVELRRERQGLRVRQRLDDGLLGPAVSRHGSVVRGGDPGVRRGALCVAGGRGFSAQADPLAASDLPASGDAQRGTKCRL
jgi:hypothetical protein